MKSSCTGRGGGGSLGSGGGGKGPRQSSLLANSRREYDAKHFNPQSNSKLTEWASFYGPIDEPAEGFDAVFAALGRR